MPEGICILTASKYVQKVLSFKNSAIFNPSLLTKGVSSRQSIIFLVPLSGMDLQTEKTTPVSKQELKNLNSICIPVSGRVTSEYSWRVHPISGKYLFHSGVDIAGNMGEDIKCALDGKVIELDTVGTATSYGKYIKVEHENGVITLYGHCSKIINRVGDSVKKGQVIALVGSTGNSTGPHLPFEVRVNGQKLDPSLVADFV